MLLGSFYNTLDPQRRVTIPKSLRSELGQNPIITRGLDGGIFLFPESHWTQFVNNLEQQSFTKKNVRDFLRYMTNDAFSGSPDSLGRLTLPPNLAQAAGIERDIVVVGSLQYVEIWDRDRYHAYLQGVSERAEAISEELEWSTDAHPGT
jgi:MraZ protein